MPKAAQCMPDANTLSRDEGVSLEVCQCAGCGLVQLSNDPVPYHREVIRAAAFSPEMKAFRECQFQDFVKTYGLAGRKVIEIGCGKGEYLSIMEAAGAVAYGLEYSGESVDVCRQNGLKVTAGYIENESFALKAAPFDAFFILNFLEHMPDPKRVLKGICNNLGVGGIGLVEVPNFDMILQKNLFSEFIGDHLYYFTRETLSLALQLSGFEILECNVVWHDYIISAVVKKRGKADVSAYAGRQQQLQEELNAFIARFTSGKVAVWGAGHQALAIMALAKLGDKVAYVIDSAPFKQGKYTPATHVRIVAPDTLDLDPVEAVIVMAASYSDEVAGILARKYGRKIAVAIVREQCLEIL
jgi:2-polyprenyl-3-methyl-5-hydroxy-6-metoxy-1,4-benzoquinol methylase